MLQTKLLSQPEEMAAICVQNRDFYVHQHMSCFSKLLALRIFLFLFLYFFTLPIGHKFFFCSFFFSS